MKHLIILGDGMADWPVASLGGKTLLQHAQTPNMDKLARLGRTGMLKTVPVGFHPGSEVANTAILGYNLKQVYEGRGSLEAASIGYELKPGDMAMRCNLICVADGRIKNHSAGHITTEEADVLIRFLQEEFGKDKEFAAITLTTGIQYRHLLVIKDGDKRLRCTAPHDVPGQEFMPLLVKPKLMEAQPTADLINRMILRSQELLANHPLNLKRVAEGKDPANSLWPWSPGYRPSMVPLTETYPSIKSGAVISAVDLIKGIGHYAGLRNIEVEGATGLYNTNYEGKVAATLDALRTDDFVYLHIEASDEAGHEGDVPLKIRTIEYLDSRVVGPILEEVSRWDEPVAIAILPDHPTPCEHRTHTADPVPFLIYYPGIEADSVQTFDEVACKQGACGVMESEEFMKEFMNC
ncbi:MAG: cofactor-independent phosphoglycerate mutase [Bacteroidaceae bacterium]|nr:cofactor-independent phosphoglycerate mutase [Bacteroidaceae bacterium]